MHFKDSQQLGARDTRRAVGGDGSHGVFSATVARPPGCLYVVQGLSPSGAQNAARMAAVFLSVCTFLLPKTLSLSMDKLVSQVIKN
jgi:hypothetical protein